MPQNHIRLDLVANIFKALGHPIRLGILEILGTREKCVCDIVSALQADTSNISKHLSVMKNAGILGDRKEGLKVYYRVIMPCALNFVDCAGKAALSAIEDRREALAG